MPPSATSRLTGVTLVTPTLPVAAPVVMDTLVKAPWKKLPSTLAVVGAHTVAVAQQGAPSAGARDPGVVWRRWCMHAWSCCHHTPRPLPPTHT
jgi:hypothetical protein